MECVLGDILKYGLLSFRYTSRYHRNGNKALINGDNNKKKRKVPLTFIIFSMMYETTVDCLLICTQTVKSNLQGHAKTN